MNFIFLSQVSGILRPFAFVMGKILDLIYRLVDVMGIPNIALCIVLFTIVIKMITLPLTIKQQRTAKVSAKMQPEIQAIQEKYKNADRSNRDVMMRMTEEQQAVYRKYGTSPFGGCLPLILMFFIIFALYRVIYAIPAYVPQVKEMYKPVSEAFMEEVSKSDEFKDTYTVALKEFLAAEGGSIRDRKTRNSKYWNENQVIDAMSVFSTTAWDDFLSGKIFYTTDKYSGEEIEDSKRKNWNELAKSEEFKKAVAGQDVKELLKVNNLFNKYSILDTPNWKSIMILIPILAALLQYLQTKLSMAVQKSGDEKKKTDPSAMGSSMESMMKVMPIMSGIFCLFFPIGIGLYWVINSAVSILQQIVINKQLDKLSIDDIVAANEEKENDRKKKMGIIAQGSETSSIAKKSTKTITVDKDNKSSDNDKRPAMKVSDAKKEELKKNAAEGKSNISAIANLYRNDDKEE